MERKYTDCLLNQEICLLIAFKNNKQKWGWGEDRGESNATVFILDDYLLGMGIIALP